MNSGPLPPSGGLPAPLHDTPDSRINYGSTLLGDLQPYAYGEAGYMSSQSQNNQPHRIQKIIPELYLPEPHGKDVFQLSHAVDDSDLAFVMRLNRNSVFCTGSRTSTRRNTKIGTSVDPIINLATLNYLLAGIQTSMPMEPDKNSLWWEFLHNLDPKRWPSDLAKRNYNVEPLGYELNFDPKFKDQLTTMEPKNDPFSLDDIIHFIRHCIKPFGIVRGSEKQGGQHEMSSGPATWTAPTIATLVIDGKEANVLNLWHHKDMHAGDDLVLRLKLMPLKTYTLNHYYKGFARKSFEVPHTEKVFVWQMVPDIFELEIKKSYYDELKHLQNIPKLDSDIPYSFKDDPYDLTDLRKLYMGFIKNGPYILNLNETNGASHDVLKFSEKFNKWTHVQYPCLAPDPSYCIPWQELGFWHIGRSQVMRKTVGSSEFYNDDMANNLRTNHVDMTFQPSFQALPRLIYNLGGEPSIDELRPRIITLSGKGTGKPSGDWAPQLRLEQVDEPVTKRAHTSSKVTWGGDKVKERRDMVRNQPEFQKVSSAPAWQNPISSGLTMQDFEDMVGDIEPPNQPLAAGFASKMDGLTSHAEEALHDDHATAGLSLPEAEKILAVSDPLTVETAEGVSDIAPAISEASREELMSGLPAPKKAGGRAGAKARKTATESAGGRGPVEGTLLRPGAAPEPCQMELL